MVHCLEIIAVKNATTIYEEELPATVDTLHAASSQITHTQKNHFKSDALHRTSPRMCEVLIKLKVRSVLLRVVRGPPLFVSNVITVIMKKNQ